MLFGETYEHISYLYSIAISSGVTMQIHPIVPLRKAASLLGVDKDQLKAKLISGEIKGEQRRVGSKDKWFVYSGEVSNRIDTERLPELMKRTAQTDGQLALEVETILETDPISLTDLDAFFEESESSTTAHNADTEQVTEVEKIEITADSISHAEKIITDIEAKAKSGAKPEVKGGVPATMEFNHIFESLTVVFAQRLSDEYQRVLSAEQKVKTAETRLKVAEQKTKAYEENIKRLEVQRDEAQFVVDERNSTIAELELQMREMQQKLDAKKPSFWQKLFGA
jgi:hypothetical protein